MMFKATLARKYTGRSKKAYQLLREVSFALAEGPAWGCLGRDLLPKGAREKNLRPSQNTLLEPESTFCCVMLPDKGAQRLRTEEWKGPQAKFKAKSLTGFTVG